MKKLKLFLENFLVYGFGGIISKIIPLLMVPIITRLMPDTTYYGISDLSSTLISFGRAFASMGMYDAMYRMFFENEEREYKEEICSTTLAFTIFTSFVVFIILILGSDILAQYVFRDRKYVRLVYISATATLVGATNNIVSAPTRMQNRKKTYLIMNMLSSFLSYAVAVPLLLNGNYAIALPLAGLVAGLTCEIIFLTMNHNWFKRKKIRLQYLKPMLKMAVPLLPNFLIYWIISSSDRLMVTNIMDAAATGIYAVGSKLGNASQLIYTAFAGGWQYFAFSTMKEDGQVETNSKIFEYLGLISYVSAVFVFALSKVIYNALFVGEYVAGFIVAPYLYLAPLLQMLFQVISNQFLVIKKTTPNMFVMMGGAVVNVVLNMCLIPLLGIEGAAIATLMGYAITVVVAALVLLKMRLMVIRKQFILATIVMIVYILLWRFVFIDKTALGIIFAILFSGALLLLYGSDLKQLFRNLKKKSDM